MDSITHPLSGMQLELDAAGLTHVGKVREVNEDQFLVATLERRLRIHDTSVKANALNWLPTSTEGLLLIVADGMGGAEGGGVASSVAVRAIGDYLCSVLPLAQQKPNAPTRSMTIPGLSDGLASALAVGDEQVRTAAAIEQLSPEMGTTTTVAYVAWPKLYLAHVGDSRCYLLHLGKLQQLTTDHTFAERLRSKAAVEVDDDSPLHHVLWNVLGGGQTDAVSPDIHRRELEPTDTLLLCSDGVTKHLDDERIELILREATSSSEACTRLVTEANEAGGSDNITAVVVRRRRPTSGAESGSDGPTRIVPPR